jgi:hypothetical protein
MWKLPPVIAMAMMLHAASVYGSEKIDTNTVIKTTDVPVEKEPPWLVMPTFSSDPKVGTSFGFLGGYLHKFDASSTSSMFGAAASYSNTDSTVGGLFARTYWDADSKRLTAFAGGGKINNDYSDFLGSSLPASTTDNMKAFFTRYLQQVRPGWFVGVQGVYTNYLIVGDNFLTEEILKLLGLTGFDSGALGLVAKFDDRDNQNAPSRGRSFTAHNFAYREGLGGEENFDTLNIEYKQYWAHSQGDVLALRANGRWTSDAPASGYSSVNLRGYTRGQYLAPHSITLEVEERLLVKGRFGVNIFAGVTCLYGGTKDCGSKSNYFPSAGLGVQYMLKESENMVLTLDYAKGKQDSSGFYMRFGQAF